MYRLGQTENKPSLDKLKHITYILILFFSVNSYAQSFTQYSGKILGSKIELISTWVNYMTKFESNPMHTHDEDLSFVLFTEVPKDLREEYSPKNRCVSA